MTGRHAPCSNSDPSSQGAAARTVELFEKFHATHDRAVREQLIVEHRWLAEQCARRFRFRGEPEDDLVQAAYLGLIKAIDRYDPGLGVPFHGYAIPTILGELKRHFRDTTWSVAVPRRAKDLLPRLSTTTDLLHQRLGRSPTVAELADEMGIDREAVVAAIAARGANRTRPLAGPTPDGSERQLAIGDDGMLIEEIDTRLEALEALGQLDERSRKILWWRFYEERTQREIGERLGIGQVQVSRLLRAALDRLGDTPED